MHRIIVIANQKGGVGKTTTAINLSASLAAMEKRVLLIDCDPQANASSGINVTPDDESRNTYRALYDPERVNEMIMPSAMEYLDVLPSIQDLVAAELELVDKIGREYFIRDVVGCIDGEYEYVFMDCPPSLGLITINSLCAATDLLIPLQCEYYAMEGIAHLMNTFSLVRKRLNTSLNLLGVVLTMFDKRNKLSHQVEHEVRAYFQDKVFQSVIPRNVRLSEAPSHGLPALCYDYRSTGSQAYLKLGQEIISLNREVEHS